MRALSAPALEPDGRRAYFDGKPVWFNGLICHKTMAMIQDLKDHHHTIVAAERVTFKKRRK